MSPTDGNLVNTAVMVRLVLRRDRVRLPIWIAGIVALVVVSAASVSSLYGTPEKIREYVQLSDGNPTLVAVNGPGIGFESPNVGVVLVNEASLWGAVACALMSVFLVVRHTRGEEEAERVDLLRSGVLGRHAPLAAAGIVVGAANLVVSLVVFALVVPLGFPAAGTAAFAAAMGLVGLVFTGLAAICAQVFSSARAALGAGVALVGLAYGIRAAGDVAESPLSWLSPLGWSHRVRAYAGEQWWVLALCAAVAAAAWLTARVLADHRDLGGGLLAQRLGRPEASALLSSPVGLAVRLQRGQVLAWSVGLFVLGLVYGAVGRDVEQMFEDNPDLEEFIQQVTGASITDSYLSYTLLIGAMMSGGFAISSVLRLRSEELAGRTELVLAGPTTRRSWVVGQYVVSAVGVAVLLAASGVGTGIGLAVAVGDAGEVPRLLGASMAHLPAVLVLVGVTAWCQGAVPRWAQAAWLALGVVVVVGMFGDLLRLPHWVRMISPLEHVPGMPAEPLRVLPLVVLSAVALIAAELGAAAFRRRDLAVT